MVKNSSAAKKSSGGIGESTGKRKVDTYFVCGLAASIVLVCAGVALLLFARIPTSAHLLLSCGLGIVMWTFGSRAKVENKYYVAGGSFAVAVIAFGLLKAWPSGTGQEKYAQFQISNIPDSLTLAIEGADPLFGTNNGETYEFLALESHLKKRFLTATFTRPDETEFEVRCIPSRRFITFLGTDHTLFFEFSSKSEAITDEDGKSISLRSARNGQARAKCGGAKAGVPGSKTDGTGTLGATFFARAFAGSQQKSIPELIRALELRSTFARRKARRLLADKGPDIVEPLLKALRPQALSYRKTLGIAVALTLMLRENKQKAPEIAREVAGSRQLGLLIRLTGHRDRTLRAYVTEFLSGLESREVAKMALSQLSGASGDHRYNLLIVVRSGLGKFSDSEKQIAATELAALASSASPKFKRLAGALIKMAKNGPVRRKYRVIVGRFRDINSANAYVGRVRKTNPALKLIVGKAPARNRLIPVFAGEYSSKKEALAGMRKALRSKFIDDAFITSVAE